MASVVTSHKQCTVNPLKMSQPIGAALAFMGIRGCMPLLHGSQGCTSFGLVLFVRHFRESIPLQTTAMNEVATVLGGFENVEAAVLNIVKRTKPEFIGICSTGVTEVKGDDLAGFVAQIRARHPELAGVALVPVSTPDYRGAFQDGWAAAIRRTIEELVPPADGAPIEAQQIALLPGSHLTVGDLEELHEIVSAFGLRPVIFPDLSGSLDGHIPEDFTPTTLGGIGVEQIVGLGRSAHAIALGEQMRPAAVALRERANVDFTLFDRCAGLGPSDDLVALLARLSGRTVPEILRRRRGQLLDAMLDGHFHFGGKKIAIAAEPDLLWNMAALCSELGGEIQAAVTTTASPVLERIPAAEVLIGDLEDLERRAAGCDLLMTHSHGRQAAARLDVPLHRIGLPLFDCLGAAHRTSLGYRGTRDTIFEIGNILMAHGHETAPPPHAWGRTEEEVDSSRLQSPPRLVTLTELV